LSLQDDLDRLWGEVRLLGRPVVDARNPGIDAAEVRRVLGSDVPNDVIEWFRYGDGVAYVDGQTQDDAALVPGYYPLSLAEAVEIRSNYGGDLGSWWLPLLSTGGGDFYAAAADSMGNLTVRSVMNGGVERRAYMGIEEMVAAFVRMYREGVFFVRSDGILWADDDRWIEIESELA
jgi:hypothetical protein